MSTLDCGGNSNGEIPTQVWHLTKHFPQRQNEPHNKWVNRLLREYKKELDEYEDTCGPCKHCEEIGAYKCTIHDIFVDWETPACVNYETKGN